MCRSMDNRPADLSLVATSLGRETGTLGRAHHPLDDQGRWPLMGWVGAMTFTIGRVHRYYLDITQSVAIQ